MTKNTRMKIAAKLQQGVTIERILDDIRDNISQGINREHLVARQDIHNIKTKFNIEGVRRHENDLTSVSSWVEEMRGLSYNPIWLFKLQGQPQPEEMDNMTLADFVSVIGTQFQ